MIERNEYRLIVNINDVRAKNEERAKRMLTESFEELIAFPIKMVNPYHLETRMMCLQNI